MKAYIDFENFCSYLSSMSSQEFNACNETLRENFDIMFSFDPKVLTNAKKEIKRRYGIWSTKATTNRNGKRIEWKVENPCHSCSSIDEKQFAVEDLMALYMLDCESAEKLAKQGCMLIATKGQELEVLKNLQIDSRFIPTMMYRIREMKDWQVVSNAATPCSDIILVDRYIFTKTEPEIKLNLVSLLKELSRENCGSNLNIVIFTEATYHDKAAGYINVPFPTMSRIIKEELKGANGTKPNVTFVIFKQEKHDRTILSNYRMIVSGDTFNFFKEGDNISLCTYGDWMFISSLSDTRNMDNAKSYLQDLQQIVDNAKRRLNDIQGDKKSNFLHFS